MQYWTLQKPPAGVDGQRWSAEWYVEQAGLRMAAAYVPEAREAILGLSSIRRTFIRRVGVALEPPPDYDDPDNEYGGELAEERRQQRLSLGASTPDDFAIRIFGSPRFSWVTKSPHQIVWVSPDEPIYAAFMQLVAARRHLPKTPLQIQLEGIPDKHQRVQAAVAVSELRRRSRGPIRDRARTIRQRFRSLQYTLVRSASRPVTDLSDDDLVGIVDEAEKVVSAVRAARPRGGDIDTTPAAFRAGTVVEHAGPYPELQSMFWYLFPDELVYVLNPLPSGGVPKKLPTPEEVRSDEETARDLTMLRLDLEVQNKTARDAFRKRVERARKR